MSCTSITALPRACGQGVVAGLEKVYMITFQDLAPATGTLNTYTLSTGGIINEIGLDSGKKFVEIGLLKSTAGLNEALTKDNSKGTSFLTQTFKLVLGDMTNENKTWVESVMNQPVAVLIKTRTGKYFASGLNGLFELSALEGGTGTAEADMIGYTLTFTGVDTKLTSQVDSTIVSGLIS